jgi:MFS transporter, PAT family, beta-lactamase induction signal transducer AmpG
MTPTTDAPARNSYLDAIAVYLRPRVLIVMFLGFSAGLPLALTGSTLQAWMTESHVDLRTIGLFTLVGAPYTFKFLWAPVVDALDLPVLTRLLGRRRAWLIFAQMLLMAAIVILALTSPQVPLVVAVAALMVAVASATQDIVIDAFRVESLAENEQAAGMASYVAAYRVGMLVSTAGALYLVTGFESFGFARSSAWTWSFAGMAVLVAVGMVTTLVATEPERSAVAAKEHAAHAGEHPALRVFKAAVAAFQDFLTRDAALVVLVFVVLFKLCDAFAGALTLPFLLNLGFTRNDYATVVKGVGLAATLIGGVAGGILARALPLTTCLWIAAILQALSNLVFLWLAYVGRDYVVFTVANIIESFTGAIGTVIFVAYLSALCKSPLHTATQYALLSALATFGRIFLSSPAGYVAVWWGWPMFFVLSTVLGVPALILLAWLQARGHFATLGKPKVMVADD